ncbi:MAG: hypothetical protein NTX64_09515 [Elusimicrobia bacterium]|nr:hypothetical protein [Elusimicrobiota bacterium]
MRFILIAATLLAVPLGRGAQAFVCANGTPMPIPDCCPERKAAAKGVVGALGDACGGGVNQNAVNKAVQQAAGGGDGGLGQLGQLMGPLGQAASAMGQGGGAGQSPSAQDPSSQNPTYPSDTGSSTPQTPAAPTPTNQWCPGTGTWSTSCPTSNAPVQQQVGAATLMKSNAAPALAPLPAPWSTSAPSAQAPDGSNAQAPSGLSRPFIKRPPIRVLKSRNP